MTLLLTPEFLTVYVTVNTADDQDHAFSIRVHKDCSLEHLIDVAKDKFGNVTSVIFTITLGA